MKRDRYGLLKAAELAAELVGAYERARDGATQIQVECLDADNWDDIEVSYVGRTDRWQVKRLTQELKRADALKLLASAAGSNDIRRILGVAVLVPIKNGSTIVCHLRDLAELCDEARKPGTDAALFETREHKKPAFGLVKESLAVGATPGDVLATLQSLSIRELGLEDVLRARAHAHLSDIFTNAEEVFDQISAWFLRNPDGTQVVNVALLYEHVVAKAAKRDPMRPRWIYLSRDPVRATWACRGPLAKQDLVSTMWDAGPGRVQVGAPPLAGEAASTAVARLALHRVGSSAVEVSIADATNWSQHFSTLCGGTLGVLNVPVRLGCDGAALSTPPHAPQAEHDTLTFAAELNDAMDSCLWNALVAAIDKRLAEDDLEQSLRPKLRERWSTWHACLDADSFRRASFLRSMVATVDEWRRIGFDPSVRVGPLQVQQLARATIVALAVAAAFDAAMVVDIGAKDAVNNLVLGQVQAHVLALSEASHPDTRKPLPLGQAAGHMLAAETGIAILGVVNTSASEIFEMAIEGAVPFNASERTSQSFHHMGPPPPILTASPRFAAALSKGVDALRTHLGEVLGRMNDVRLESLKQALNGAPNG